MLLQLQQHRQWELLIFSCLCFSCLWKHYKIISIFYTNTLYWNILSWTFRDLIRCPQLKWSSLKLSVTWRYPFWSKYERGNSTWWRVIMWKICIRTVNQDAYKRDTLKNIWKDQEFIIMDWTMKNLQRTFRKLWGNCKEGKASVGIYYVYSCIEIVQKMTRYNSFLCAPSLQGNTGLPLVTNILQMLHESQPHLREVYKRSDKSE